MGADTGISVTPVLAQQLPAPPGPHQVPVDSSAAPTDSSPYADAIWTHDAAHVFTAAVALVIITVVSLGVTIWILRRQLLSTR